jgi:hypothetical protein
MTALAGRRWLSGVDLDETELLEKLVKELVSVSWRSRSGRSVGRSVGRSQHLVHAALLESAVNQNRKVNTPVYRGNTQSLSWIEVNIRLRKITFKPLEFLERMCTLSSWLSEWNMKNEGVVDVLKERLKEGRH